MVVINKHGRCEVRGQPTIAIRSLGAQVPTGLSVPVGDGCLRRVHFDVHRVRCLEHRGCVLGCIGVAKKGENSIPKTKTPKRASVYDEECQHPHWVLKFLAELCVHFWLSKRGPCFRHGGRPAKREISSTGKKKHWSRHAHVL